MHTRRGHLSSRSEPFSCGSESDSKVKTEDLTRVFLHESQDVGVSSGATGVYILGVLDVNRVRSRGNEYSETEKTLVIDYYYGRQITEIRSETSIAEKFKSKRCRCEKTAAHQRSASHQGEAGGQ